METLKLNKDHWSFKLIALIYDKESVEWEIRQGWVDTCQYNKMIFLSSFWVGLSVLTMLITTFSATFVTILAGISLIHTSIPWFLVIEGVRDILSDQSGTEMFFFVWGITVILTPMLLGSVLGIIYLVVKTNDARPVIRMPSKTQELYTSWKEKYCKKIELE